MAQMTKLKKGIKKKFFDVECPLVSTKVQLYGGELEEFQGRVIKLDLSRALRGKNSELKLRVKVEGTKLVSEPVEFELLGAYTRKIIARGTNYVEDSFKTNSRDARVLVKTFLMTRLKVSRAVRNALRQQTRALINSHFNIRTSAELFNEILAYKFQKMLSQKLRTVYPLSVCEIKAFKVVGKRDESAKVVPQEVVEKKDN